MKKKPLSLLICIFSLALFLSYHVYYYCINEINKQKVNNYIDIEQDNLSTNIVEKINNETPKEEYLGILEIKKINFKMGFYRINSANNTVNKGLELLKNSEMPNIPGSSLYIASHSGASYLGYFNDLDKLKVEDEVKIYYQDKEYFYSVFDIYEVEKDGKIEVEKNVSENILVLTTCSKKQNQQLVVICKLINEI